MEALVSLQKYCLQLIEVQEDVIGNYLHLIELSIQ